MKEENAGKQMKSVWRFSTPSDEEKRLGKHPTQKPLALIARCLRATTDPRDLVFDPFSGSGSTGVAALKLGRHFVGCEQDKTYSTLAARRLNEAAPGEIEADATTTASGLRSREPRLPVCGAESKHCSRRARPRGSRRSRRSPQDARWL